MELGVVACLAFAALIVSKEKRIAVEANVLLRFMGAGLLRAGADYYDWMVVWDGVMPGGVEEGGSVLILGATMGTVEAGYLLGSASGGTCGMVGRRRRV